ncbi:amidohydrolase family protein [Candidatus Poribacteria bacterium]|nr:amidohydrolase family protein [Candidatus Poribacteria bacterium]
MFIDIHAHAYRKTPPFICQFCTAEQLIRRYDEVGIEKGVLLPIVSPEIYFPQSNEDILDMVEKHPDRFIPFCNIDPRALTNSPDAPLDRILQHYQDQGCKGLGEVMPNMQLIDPMVQNLFKHAEEVGFPVIFDGSDQIGGDFGLYDETGLPQLERTLKQFPELIILGHGPIFWSEIGHLEPPAENVVFRPRPGQIKRPRPSNRIAEEGVMPKLMRKYSNLYGDLSDWNPWNALSRDPKYGPKFMTEFQDRLLFGTDICSYDMPLPMIDLLIEWRDTKKISELVFNKIARENAIKLLNL